MWQSQQTATSGGAEENRKLPAAEGTSGTDVEVQSDPSGNQGSPSRRVLTLTLETTCAFRALSCYQFHLNDIFCTSGGSDSTGFFKRAASPSSPLDVSLC